MCCQLLIHIYFARNVVENGFIDGQIVNNVRFVWCSHNIIYEHIHAQQHQEESGQKEPNNNNHTQISH